MSLWCLQRRKQVKYKVRLIYFKVLKHRQRCGYFFCKQIVKKVRLTFFEVKSQQQRYAWCIYRFNWLTKGVADTFRNQSARRTVQITCLKLSKQQARYICVWKLEAKARVKYFEPKIYALWTYILKLIK